MDFNFKNVIAATVTLCIIKELIKLFYLNCSYVEVVEKSNEENIKVIKNTRPNNSGNPESLKK